MFKERSRKIEEQDALIAKIRSCKNMGEAMLLIPRLEKLEDQIDELEAPQAF